MIGMTNPTVPRKQIMEVVCCHLLSGKYLSLDGLSKILRRQQQIVALRLLTDKLSGYKSLLLSAGVHYTQNPQSRHYKEIP